RGGRVLRDASRDITYADDGAMATVRSNDSVRRLNHDVNGRLVSVIEENGTSIQYEYDPFGRRTAKVVDGRRTAFVWEGWALAAELPELQAPTIHMSIDLRPVATWKSG